MPLAIIAIVGVLADLVLPGVLIYIVFGPGSTSNAQKLGNWGSALITPAINTAINAYVKVAVIFVVIGGVVYVLETQYAKHEGQTLPAPPVQALGPPPPPTFGASGGIGFQKGGVGFSQGVGLGQAAPVLQPSGEGSGRPNVSERLERAYQSSREAKAARNTERRTQELHEQRLRENKLSIASRAGSGFTARSGRARYRRDWR